MEEILKGKRILIVDDEADILETLAELLDMCLVDTAPNFDSAKKFLNKSTSHPGYYGGQGLRSIETHQRKKCPCLNAHSTCPQSG